MRIDVTCKHLELTATIREHAESKCSKLPRFYDGVQQIECVLDVEHERHEEFSAELVVSAEKHEPFVAKEVASSMYAAIDGVVDKMTRQLHDFKDKLRDARHH